MTDDFETTARAEAMRRFPHPVDVITGEPVDDWGYEAYAREAHIEGWHAARAHLAAQEVTEGEVEAAARELWRAIWIDPDEHPWESEATEAERRDCRREARAALTAARKARR